MLTKKILDSDDVNTILLSATNFAVENEWPVSIAIVDDAGFLLAFKRLDNAPLFSVNLAIEKAKSSALSKRDSKALEDLVAAGRTAFIGVGEIICIEGGVLIRDNSTIVGAIGVSGVSSHDDAAIALHGAEAWQLL